MRKPGPGQNRQIFLSDKRKRSQDRYQKATIVPRTSPAKIFPNKRKAKERTLGKFRKEYQGCQQKHDRIGKIKKIYEDIFYP